MEEITEIPGASASDENKLPGKRLGIKEFIITLIIIVAVWAAGKCVSVNQHTGNAPSLHPSQFTAAIRPVSSEVIENVLATRSLEVGTHYRAD